MIEIIFSYKNECKTDKNDARSGVCLNAKRAFTCDIFQCLSCVNAVFTEMGMSFNQSHKIFLCPVKQHTPYY